MSFGIIRVRKITSTSGISNTDVHNFRQYEEKNLPIPENITKPYFGINTAQVYGSDKLDTLSRFNDIVEKNNLKIKNNSVLALEYVVALSPDAKRVYDVYSAETILRDLSEYVIRRHGNDNVLSVSLHFDETNPHAHIVVMPITKKEVKWKNRRGQGVKIEKRLCAADFVKDRAMLRDLQTGFYNHAKTHIEPLVNVYLDKANQLELFRGVDAREKHKSYSHKTDHSIGQLREDLRKLEEKEMRLPIKTKEQSKSTFEKMNPFPHNQDKKKSPGLSM
jgi:hypothetical protein